MEQPTEEIDHVERHAADAVVHFKLTSDDCKAEFVTSWLGANDETAAMLTEVGLEPQDHLGELRISVFGGTRYIQARETRLLCLDFAQQDPLWIDFLYKNKGGVSTSVRRLSLDLDTQPIDPYGHTDFFDNSLGRVISAVCRSISGHPVDSLAYIDEEATIWVHDQLLNVRDKALVASQDQWEVRSKGALSHSLEREIDSISSELGVRGVILDMDNTLFPTSSAVLNLEPLEKTFNQLFNADYTLYEDALLKESPLHIFQLLERRGTLKPGLSRDDAEEQWFRAYAMLEVRPKLSDALFPGYTDLLSELRRLEIRTAIVTSGVWILQAQKAQLANLPHLVEAIIIDDVRAPVGKQTAFEAISRKWKLPTKNVLVVGDGTTELAAAVALGMPCVHFRFNDRSQCGECNANHVATVAELRDAIESRLARRFVES